MANRTITMPAVWANGAPDVPGGGAVTGTTYANSVIDAPTIEAGWPFATIDDSSTMNEVMQRITSLLSQNEKYGILPWCSLTAYEVGALASGSNGTIYIAIDANTGYDPISSTVHWRIYANEMYLIDTGTINNLIVTPTPSLLAHVVGFRLLVKAANTVTAGTIITIGSLAAASILLNDGSALSHGNIRKNGIYTLIYAGTYYILQNPSERTGDVRMAYNVPVGWLQRNGALISRTTYADLYSYAYANSLITTENAWLAGDWGLFGTGDGSSTFRLPDARGMFERGLDSGRGIDLSRTLGSSQKGTLVPGDAGNEMIAVIGVRNNQASPSVLESQTALGMDPVDVSKYSTAQLTGVTSAAGGTSIPGSSERLAGVTRPVNISLIPIIKA